MDFFFASKLRKCKTVIITVQDKEDAMAEDEFQV